MCHNIYESEDFVTESTETILAEQEIDPPKPVRVTKKRMSKPDYGGERDDLGYLSLYIIEMACENKVNKIETDEVSRQKELLESTCMYKKSCCNSA